MLFSTHYMDEAERLDHIAIIVEGKIVAFGTPPALMAQTGHDNLEDAFVALAGGEGLLRSDYSKQASVASRPLSFVLRLSSFVRHTKESLSSVPVSQTSGARRSSTACATGRHSGRPCSFRWSSASFTPCSTPHFFGLQRPGTGTITIPAQGISYAGQGLIDIFKAQKITLEPFTGDLKRRCQR